MRTDLPWQDLGISPIEGSLGVYVVSKDYVVRQIALTATEVIRREDGRVVVRHEASSPAYETIFADIAGDRVVIMDEEVGIGPDGEKDAAQAYVYDLATGRRTDVSTIPSAPRLAIAGSGTVTDDGRFYFGASDNGRTDNCVGMLDLETMRGTTVACADEKDGVIFRVSSGDGGATWLDVKGPTFDDCREGKAVRDGSVVTMRPPGCATNETTTLGGWDVRTWGTLTFGAHVEAADKETTMQLDAGFVTHLVECGGWAYWHFHDDDSQIMQVRRWRPNHEPEIAYSVNTPPDTSPDALWLAPTGCADGILTVAVQRMEPDSETVQIVILQH